MNLLLISDFNLRTFADYLHNSAGGQELSVNVAPFGQVVPVLLQSDNVKHKTVAVVWTSAEKMVPSFQDALCFNSFDEHKLLSEVEEFACCIRRARTKFGSMFVVSWTLPVWQRGLGIIDVKAQGIRRLLTKMNLKLSEELEKESGIYILDAQRWVETVGRYAYSPKLWYLTKTPFHPDLFKEAAHDVLAAVAGIQGLSKKLLIVDLDDTLWGGLVGEVGWQNLRLGGHDHLGEAFADFQKALKGLTNRGILLGIVSKNEEPVALEAITRHPEMILRLEDFAGWRINWKDKASNVASLAADLNLGLQSVVFIDDSAVERARVRETLPEVLVPDWPQDKTLYASTLLGMDCFDSPYLTREDLTRNRSYAARRQREQLSKTVGSVEEWLLSLATHLIVDELNDANRVRIVQLLNKTNQMNLSTRRLTENELLAWLLQKDHKLWGFRVQDRLEDSGLTGVLSIEADGDTARIVDFLLSCRVLGRKVEQAMLSFAIRYGQRCGFKKLEARFIQTPKNKPCLDFWMSSGFSYDPADYCFTWSLDRKYAFPAGITVECTSALTEGETVLTGTGLTR